MNSYFLNWFVLGLGCLTQARYCAADTVFIIPKQGGGKITTLTGTILDYTGRQLSLQTAGGHSRAIPSKRVQHVQTKWNLQHQAGNHAWQQADWQTAIIHYRSANRIEERTWVRRQILTQLMRAYQSNGNLLAAGKLFLLIASSDPETPAFQHMPLAWQTAGKVEQQQGETWLAMTDVPAAVLLGASHLLSTPAKSDALRALNTLLKLPQPAYAGAQQNPVSILAQGQLWRAHASMATEEEVGFWSKQVETFPESLRAGPYWVLGVAFQRLQQFDRASLYYLRIPILFTNKHSLAAPGLVAAARLQQQRTDPSTAIKLLREVVTQYKGTTEEKLAQRLLAQWKKQEPGQEK